MIQVLDRYLETAPGRIALLVIRLAIGALFVYASLDKIWDPGAFAEAIYNYRLLPEVLLHSAAIMLPWLELICGILLIMNVYPETSAGLILAMLLVFTLAIVSAIARGLDFSCGCFNLNSDTRNMSFWKVLENIGMMLMAFISWWNAHRMKKDPTSS